MGLVNLHDTNRKLTKFLRSLYHQKRLGLKQSTKFKKAVSLAENKQLQVNATFCERIRLTQGREPQAGWTCESRGRRLHLLENQMDFFYGWNSNLLDSFFLFILFPFRTGMSLTVILYLFQHCIWEQITYFLSFTGPQMERNCAPGWITSRASPWLNLDDLDTEIWDFGADLIYKRFRTLNWSCNGLRLWGNSRWGEYILHVGQTWIFQAKGRLW